jgi:signal transduction histidine kinase
MNPYLARIQELISQHAQLDDTSKTALLKALSDADKQWAIVDFKLDRTEKVKKTTAILLEETIEELEQKRKAVEESKNALQQSLENLKAAQTQLIQSEKMASLGELTAGIAHEIQNPLNFVNNFSEINAELSEEILEAVNKGDLEEIKALAIDIKSNQEKIREHGKRADSIVKGMLQHSRTSSGTKEPTDINTLCDEYLRLAFHGIRAKDKTFNAQLETDFDPNIPKLNVIPQDMGRVILNLLNNAFYAVKEKSMASGQSQEDSYKPTVEVRTKRVDNNIQISVADNGNGIPPAIKDKIFQPFFTTKPTGQGTGLGLSLSYDIVTKGHGGELTVDTTEGTGTNFTIKLPLQ